MNRKYGDTFGTYKSLTEWYDTLIQKGNAYVESLFMQAKAQSYIKKAIEADEKANEIRSKGKEEYRPFWGAGGKLNMFFGGDNIGQYGSDPAETAFNKALQEEENKKQHYLNEVEWFQKEATRIFKEAGLSDYRTIETDDDTAKTEEEKRKQARQKLNDELLALEQQNQQDWLDLQEEGTQKKLARIDADYDRQKAEIEKKARELAELNRKAGVTDTNAAGLTDRQQEEIDRANTLAEDTRKKEVTAVYREEAVAMRDYLKEYGSYQQQKLAIAEEYAEKIRRAQSEGERLSLEKRTGLGRQPAGTVGYPAANRLGKRIRQFRGDVPRTGAADYRPPENDRSKPGVPILRRRRRDGSPVWLDFHPATVGDDVERGDFPANQRRPRLLSKRHAGLHGRAAAGNRGDRRAGPCQANAERGRGKR